MRLTRHDALTASEFHANGGCVVGIVGPRGGMPKHRMEIWRRNGQPKTWKRTDAVRVPVKHGMRDYSYVNWPEDAGLWHTRADCPVIHAVQGV